MRRASVLIVALTLSLLFSACGASPQRSDEVPSVAREPGHASQSGNLLTTFTTEPSYLGRFISDDVPVGTEKEHEAFDSPCGACFSRETSGLGGATYDETYGATSAVIDGKDLSPLYPGKDLSKGALLRVVYDGHEKTMARIEPKKMVAFQACCEQAPGNCPKRYISEYVSGKGALYSHAASEASGAVQTPMGGAQAGGAGGVSHVTKVKFSKTPVYFAFKTSPTPYKPWDCPDEAPAQPPRSNACEYVFGDSGWGPSAKTAREDALFEARREAAGLTNEENAAPLQPRCSWDETMPAPYGPQFRSRAMVCVPRVTVGCE
jgi:hypothetical protein